MIKQVFSVQVCPTAPETGSWGEDFTAQRSVNIFNSASSSTATWNQEGIHETTEGKSLIWRDPCSGETFSPKRYFPQLKKKSRILQQNYLLSFFMCASGVTWLLLSQLWTSPDLLSPKRSNLKSHSEPWMNNTVQSHLPVTMRNFFPINPDTKSNKKWPHSSEVRAFQACIAQVLDIQLLIVFEGRKSIENVNIYSGQREMSM